MYKQLIRTGIIGHPVAHSKSPLIHNYWITRHGLHGRYDAIDIPVRKLKEQLPELIAEGFKGFNVTIPHKKAALQLCDEIDDTAKRIGAVNMLTVAEGHIKGTNTDIFGFLENIREGVPDFDFSAGPALVIGAGGAARAVIEALLSENVPEIRLTNRTYENAVELAVGTADPDKVKIVSWQDRDEGLSDLNLVVNTSALGMTGKPPLDFELNGLPEEAVVNDIVYTPEITDLLRAARDRGNRIVTGIGMLLQQARPAFEEWYGVMPEITEELLEKVRA